MSVEKTLQSRIEHGKNLKKKMIKLESDLRRKYGQGGKWNAEILRLKIKRLYGNILKLESDSYSDTRK